MKIEFSNRNNAELVIASRHEDVDQAVKDLGLHSLSPVLVLVGGAGGVTEHQLAIISQVIGHIAEVTEIAEMAIVDGGTDSGIMTAIGQARDKGRYNFPLVGVAVENLVNWPGEPSDRPASQDRYPLESHHSHFILVPGQNWGDESESLANVGTVIAGKHHSVTILVNGGNIAKKDISHSLAANRPVLVLSGTGRYADELAADPPDSDLIQIVPAQEHEVVKSKIRSLLA